MSWQSAYESIEAVRCVGNYNAKKTTLPRAHHKFVVFCRHVERDDSSCLNYQPYGVWTGSFNFTQNAVKSLENAVVLRDPSIVQAYFQEYAQIAALSELLDWEKHWVEPQWRIGS
jgi:phosphatidylserine/phosphatidylglycerophosphate/cardiolipin synthase-like enzyme